MYEQEVREMVNYMNEYMVTFKDFLALDGDADAWYTFKREAYACDITYTTNSELGFDYLRDNMAPTLEGRVLRGLYFTVVDEADSILVDESRTPLIISGGQKSAASQYQVADRFVKYLRKDKDYEIDITAKARCSASETSTIQRMRISFTVSTRPSKPTTSWPAMSSTWSTASIRFS